MPFDPNLPQGNTLIDAAQMRGQLNGLKTLIDEVPAGPPGPQGDPGPQGPQDDPGPQGPPFASAAVDAVNMLPPGDPATVSVSFDGTNVHFTFDIPQGATGEVTTAALDAAIAGTAQNHSGIPPFAGTFSDPPTQAEMDAVAAYVESLRAWLVR